MMTKTMITCEEFEKLALAGKLSPWCELVDGEIVKKFPRGGKAEIIHDGGEIDGGKILPGFNVPVSRFFDED